MTTPAAKNLHLMPVEGQTLINALRDGLSWDEAKALLPQTDPDYLDRGFKTWAMEQAGLVEKANPGGPVSIDTGAATSVPQPVVPAAAPPPVEEPEPTPAKPESQPHRRK